MATPTNRRAGLPPPKRVKLSDRVLQPIQPIKSIYSLPVELKTMVFQQLKAADHVALSLTCKEFARIGRNMDLPLENNIWTRVEKAMMLQQLKSWFPSDMKLCLNCLRYRPKDPHFWTDVIKIGNLGPRTQCLRNWNDGPYKGKHMCPECNPY